MSRVGCKAKEILVLAMVLGAGIVTGNSGRGQSFTNLYSFSGNDGEYPRGALVSSGQMLYGSTFRGGAGASGTVFVINNDGTGFTNLHYFSGASDGALLWSRLLLAGGTLYGTASQGGSANNGTLFSLGTNGANFAPLHYFSAGTGVFPSITNSDGVNPFAGLAILGNTLYGTTYNGGASGRGTVFAVHIDGTGFTNLHAFTSGPGVFQSITNADGAYPRTGLVLSGNTLFGTATFGGASAHGTIFALNTDSTGFRTLHSFSNIDGAAPAGALVLSGDTLFGTTQQGGASSNGTVFAITTNGTAFATLHSFTGGDGASPLGDLFLSGNMLFGTALQGGSASNGAVFSVQTNGTNFSTLYSFAAGTGAYPAVTNSDGAFPYGGLVLSGDSLFGVASSGGGLSLGTVFGLVLPQPPPLTIAKSGASVVLAWAVGSPVFTLQSSTNLSLPGDWTAVLPGPVVVNGTNTVTNAASDPQRFFKLGK